MRTIISLVFLLCASSDAAMAPKSMTEFNKKCPAPAACEKVVALRDACEKSKTDCDKFVEELKQLLPEYDCQREFDKTTTDNYIVPAIWLCDHDHKRMESLLHSLHKLKTPAAMKLFRSQEIKKTFDGHVAETFNPLWEAAQPKPKGKTPLKKAK